MDLTIFKEVTQILDALNEEHNQLKDDIKNMISQYHMYHILSDKCVQIATNTPKTYFETLYHSIPSLTE